MEIPNEHFGRLRGGLPGYHGRCIARITGFHSFFPPAPVSGRLSVDSACIGPDSAESLPGSSGDFFTDRSSRNHFGWAKEIFLLDFGEGWSSFIIDAGAGGCFGRNLLDNGLIPVLLDRLL